MGTLVLCFILEFYDIVNGSQIVGLLQFLPLTNLLYFSLWPGSDKFFKKFHG